MSNPQDWMIKLPGIREKADWEKQRPGETQDEYYRRTGRGFFLPGPKPGDTGQVGDKIVDLYPLPIKGQGPGIISSPTSLIDWLKKGEAHNPDTPSDPIATIAPALDQVDLLEQGEKISSDPSVYYNGTEALDKMAEVFGLLATITWCRMTAYKYGFRMGKKAGNSVEQEAGKITWYLAAAERLQRQYDNPGSV